MTEIRALAHVAIYDTVERLLEGVSGRLLDVPAGEGALAQRLVAKGFDVSACDLYPEIFKLDGVPIAQADLDGRLPYEDSTFDVVVCVEGLEHIYNPGNAIAEFARILKPQGRLIASVPNIMNIEERLKWLLYGSTSHFPPLSADNLERARTMMPGHEEVALHVNPIGYSEFRFLLERNGLIVRSANVDKPKRNLWAYSPIVWLIRGVGRLMSTSRRERMWISDLNSDPVLMGGNTLILDAQKK